MTTLYIRAPRARRKGARSVTVEVWRPGADGELRRVDPGAPSDAPRAREKPASARSSSDPTLRMPARLARLCVRSPVESAENHRLRAEFLACRMLHERGGLPEAIRAQVDPKARPHALTYGKEVYLFADHIGTLDEARLAFAHDVMGHVAPNEAFGEKEWANIRNRVADMLKFGNTRAKAIAREIEDRYGRIDEDTFTREFIGVAAEKKYASTFAKFLSEIRAGIRRLLDRLGVKWPSLEDWRIDQWLSDSAAFFASPRGTARETEGRPQFAEGDGAHPEEPLFTPSTDHVSAYLKLLQNRDSAFRSPRTDAKRFQDIAETVADGKLPGLEVTEHPDPRPAAESDIARSFAKIITDHQREQADGTQQNQPGADRGSPQAAPAGREERLPAEAPQAPEALELTGQTPEDLKAGKARAEAEAKAEAEAAQKAAADEQRGSFALTGSTREADEAAARGQQDLLAPKPEEARKSIKDVPPAFIRRHKVEVEQNVDGEIQKVKVSAREALNDLARETAAFKKLRDCVGK